MRKLSDYNFKNIWKPLIIGLILAFLYLTVLAKLGRDWWTDENYSHGLLVPFVIGYIIWIEFGSLKNAAKHSSFWIGGGVILFALLMLLGGTLGAELFTQRISFVLMLAGIIVYFCGIKLVQMLIVPFALLLLSIPIPQIIFNKIAFPLQIWASQLAIWGIRLFEVASVRNGNVIEILPRGAMQIVALEVVEACSGIRSLMTLVTLALVLWYFTQTKNRFDWIRAVILMFSAIPIAILTNAARVTSTGVLTYYYGKQAADGFTHEFSGWLVYLVAFGLLLLVNFVLKVFYHRDTKDTKNINKGAEIKDQRPIINKQFYLLVSILIFSSIFINWFEQRGEISVERKSLKEMPMQLGEWQQKGNNIRFSEQTESVLRASDYVMRDYANPKGENANLYIGYYASQRSGATYHSPQNCMPGSGWEMKSPEFIEITTPSGSKFIANRYIVENGQSRQVLIYWYQGRGRAVSSEYQDKIFTILDSILKRRSDGAMVRVMLPIGNSESDSLQSAIDLSAQTADNLSLFIPN
jgi:exosortase D (VPLPA-CTERM-specific)